MTEDVGTTVHRVFIGLYSIVCALAIFVSVSSAVVTDHWKDNIQGCILYSNIRKNGTLWTMKGSDINNCNYVIFTPVFFIFICCLAIAFHLRHLLCLRCWRAEEGKTNFWAIVLRTLLLLCAFLTILSLVISCMLTHGRDITCYGLRSYIDDKGSQSWLGISSTQIHDFYSRLDCSFYYSALDYGLEIGNNHENIVIDSNAALEIAVVTSWFQFFFWLGLTLANVWLAHRMEVSLAFLIPPLPFLKRDE